MKMEELHFKYYIQDDIKFIDVAENIEPVITSNYLEHFLNHIKETFISKSNGSLYRIQASNGAIKLLEKYLYMNSEQTEAAQNLVMELYRCLRNCVTNKTTQDYVAEETKILVFTKTYVGKLYEHHLCLKIILQFLINLVSSNSEVTRKVHANFSDVFSKIIENKWCVYESAALIYNSALVVPPDEISIKCMFQLDEKSNEIEYVLFFFEKYISYNICWELYNSFEIRHKIIILETLRYQQIKKIQYFLPDSGIDTIVSGFLKSPDIFFKISTDTAQQEVRIVSLLLSIISSCSSIDEYIVKLQQNKNILVTAAALLINFHKLGKEGDNMFKPIQKLSYSQGDETENPVFGLKADLIQLIGNLCWKNNEMQNLAREAEIIPVILDCCNMDANNPFIIQWCIFAIRNFCENNPENQKFIAGLHKRGTVSSSVLESFGVTLHGDGDSELKIVPLDAFKNETK
ncbi:ataxin-10 isoform X1 [Diabrotica undecimpunctata]|uniref:ataxin-10 isoform X1 n=1 Tax=Diabrotica undecimpunctata TaxID=50387 RepID=UPI003B63EB8F